MQLILVDSSNFHVSVIGDENEQLSFYVLKKALSTEAARKSRGGGGPELSEEVISKAQLLSDILASYTSKSIWITLTLQPEEQKMRLTLSPGYTESILRKLWERFQTQVKFSIFLKYAPNKNGEFEDLAEFERLQINGEDYSSVASVDSTKTTFDKAPIIHLRLVVEVPDSMVLPPMSTARQILEQAAFSDLVICAANGAEIKGHKSFLSVASPVLKAMFESKMEESQTGRVDMTDVSEQGVWGFLRFIYYDDQKAPKHDVGVAFEMLYAAHKYHVRALESEMITCLLDKPNEDFDVPLAFKIYMFTRNIESAVQLKKKVIQILKSKIDEVEMLQEYKDLFEKPSNSKTAMDVFKDFAKTSPPPS